MADSGLDRLVAGVRRRVNMVFKDREEFDLTSGDIPRPLFYLSLPIVITNLLQTAYNLVDTIWLGQYSETALAAIGMAFPLVFFLISLGLGISIAGSILVAQNIGAGDEDQAEFAASQTVTFAIIASLLLGAFGYLNVGTLLDLIGGPENVVAGATGYLQIISLGMIFMFAFFVFMSLMRGYGDTITPMLVMFVTVVVNMVLDPFLIFGWWVFPELGINGAAYATIFSRALATVIGMAIMFRGNRGVQIHLSDMWPDLGYLRKIVRVGVPASIENTGNSIAVVIMLTIVTPFGETVIAAYTVGVRMFSVIFLPAIAVGRGVETMVGQNIGAREQDRAGRATNFAAKAMFGVLAAVGVLTWLGAPNIVAIFSDDPEVVEIGRLFLRYVAPTFGFTGIFHSYKGGFRGAGKTLTAAAISITMLGLVRLPVAYFASGEMGYEGIWLAFAVSNVAGAAIAYAWYRLGTWRDASLTDSPGMAPAPDADPDAEPATDD
ncbi:MATE family drug/sodium antiporter [Halosimplex carlsbadense 2-9-1]|uniref:MATE family drug/sodium antiporter n=1 Tax=Halosimplex carlsbadense 2-9-1 TaxID=797114 RepID=M0CUR6_9EURY|nr:MATE family efflux transporter [Halosimplex carlsbadense]ELZ25624.1 MATE family drug/sodium antiporter [Halosimplex carlsbadense 2-9-1]